MAERLKRLVLIIFATLFSVYACAAPVFAEPETNTGESPTDLSEITEVTDFSDENRETCYDAAGYVGWLVCPGAGFLSGIIDGAFNILEQLIKIKPISRDANSPFLQVWEYFRGFTNTVLVIFLLIIVFSQISGIGISNYGVKRALPRFIVGAILANVSLTICMVAMDLSTITGSGLYALFNDILASALANGNISDFAQSISIADLTAAILGIGVTGAGVITVALTMNGGVMGLMVMLLPVILAGVLAVVSAIITMAARQALVYFLAMISPLAIICYTLPNTEKWFRRWYDTFVRMLIFYPMFSVLYGASQLAGVVIITSADNWLTVILGIAVRVLPLFMTFPLLRMTGTVLGGINGMVFRLANPATRSLQRYAGESRELARQRQLANTNPNRGVSTRLAQYLENRRARRAFDTRNLTANNVDTYTTNAMASMRTDGFGSNRGYRLRAYQEQQIRKMENDIARRQIATDIDEGLDENAFGARHRDAIIANNNRFGHLVVDDHMATVRQRQVSLANAKSRADRIRTALETDKNGDFKDTSVESQNIQNQLLDTFHYQNFNSQDAHHSLRSAMATAISARNKVDREEEAEYETLFDAMPAGPGPLNQLTEAARNKDANALEAALRIVAKRGDWDLLDRKVAEITPMITGEENIEMQKRLADTLVQYKKDDWRLGLYGKALMMRRGMNGNAEYNGNDLNLRSFVTFDEFLSERRHLDSNGEIVTVTNAQGETVDSVTGENAKMFRKVCIDQLADDEKNASFVLEMDKNGIKQQVRDMYGEEEVDPATGAKTFVYRMPAPTVTTYAPDGSVLSVKEQSPIAHQLKYLRSALCDGPEGEKLKYEILMATGNFDVNIGQMQSQIKDNTFDGEQLFANRRDYLASEVHQDIIHKQVLELVRDMSPQQIAKQKSDTIKSLNAFLLAYNDAKARRQHAIDPTVDIHADKCMSADGKMVLSKEFIDALNAHGQLNALCQKNQSMRLGEMNTSIVELLGLHTEDNNTGAGWVDPRTITFTPTPPTTP